MFFKSKMMKIFNSVDGLCAELQGVCKDDVGFIPTMGALHAGHKSLVERARRECKVVVVSIFVNPTQFNDKNDLVNYPRTDSEDIKLLEEVGTDIIFMPTIEEIYPEPDSREFDFGGIGSVMEGATRKGHFNGVAQVVSRLFDIVNPAKAYFGEKDFQQIAIVRDMVRQLSLPVEIVDCDIVRDIDGLALSSRNALLTSEHRMAAPQIYKSLKEGVAKIDNMTPLEMKVWITNNIESNPLLKVIYFQSVDSLTLQEVKTWADSDRIQGCIAVQAGDIRLIDNICIK